MFCYALEVLSSFEAPLCLINNVDIVQHQGCLWPRYHCKICTCNLMLSIKLVQFCAKLLSVSTGHDLWTGNTGNPIR